MFPLQWLLLRGVEECAIPVRGLLHFPFDPYLIILSDKPDGTKYHFLSLWYDPPGNPSLSDHWQTLCSLVHSLLISCAITVMFSTRIFRNLDLGLEWVLKCKAMELKFLRCIVSRLQSAVEVKPTYVLFSLETQSPKGQLNIYIYIYIYIYTTFLQSRSSLDVEELLEIIRLEVLNLLLKWCLTSLVGSVGRILIFWIIFISICSSIL